MDEAKTLALAAADETFCEQAISDLSSTLALPAERAGRVSGALILSYAVPLVKLLRYPMQFSAAHFFLEVTQ